MDEDSLIEHLEKRPAMFGLDGSFREVSIFLEGVDLAKEGALLSGFREWLVVEVGAGNNLSWKALVLRLAFPDGVPASNIVRGLAPSDDQMAAEKLFDVLSRYRTARRRQNGLLQIFDSYLKWLRRQEWYGPGSPHYLD